MRWDKKMVERVPEGYAKKFPEDLGNCLVCNAKHSGVYMGVQMVPTDDPRIPQWAQEVSTTAMLAFSLCAKCYELPDIEGRVAQKSGEGVGL